MGGRKALVTFGQLTEKRWELVRTAQGRGALSVRELARAVGRYPDDGIRDALDHASGGVFVAVITAVVIGCGIGLQAAVGTTPWAAGAGGAASSSVARPPMPAPIMTPTPRNNRF